MKATCILGTFLACGLVHAQSEPQMSFYRVKNMTHGETDTQSRKNLNTLRRLAKQHGAILVWVTIEAPFDASFEPGTPEFDAQQILNVEVLDQLLEKLRIDKERVESRVIGPYFAVYANVALLNKLATVKGVRGFLGFPVGGTISGY